MGTRPLRRKIRQAVLALTIFASGTSVMQSIESIRASGLAAVALQPVLLGRVPREAMAAKTEVLGEGRVGGPVKASQSWTVLQHVDMRVGVVKAALLPQEMQAKYKKISSPVYAIWSDFGSIDQWPHEGDWGASGNLITAAKLRSYYSQEYLNSGNLEIVGLVNAGVKQIGKLCTYYLLTGAYTDDHPTEHNVARARPAAPVQKGCRLTILSLKMDGSRYEAIPSQGAALRPTLDFQADFAEKVDARVGEITKVSDYPGAYCIEVHFGEGLHLESRVPMSLSSAFGAGLDGDVMQLLGKRVVGMVNVEPTEGNSFLLLGFIDNGSAVPLTVDAIKEDLPPLGARLL